MTGHVPWLPWLENLGEEVKALLLLLLQLLDVLLLPHQLVLQHADGDLHDLPPLLLDLALLRR